MNSILINLVVMVLALAIGGVVGYYIRQSLAKKRAGSLEAKLQKRVIDVKAETAELVKNAEAKASEIIGKAQTEIDERRREFLKAQQVLLDREKLLEDKISVFDKKEAEFQEKAEKLKVIKEGVDKLRQEAEEKLEKVANLTREDAKKELLALVETDYQRDILARVRKMDEQGRDALSAKAREIVALAIQKVAVPHTQELSTTTLILPSEDIKGRIIGKEGRNIKTFEKVTGVELILDESADSVVIPVLIRFVDKLLKWRWIN